MGGFLRVFCGWGCGWSGVYTCLTGKEVSVTENKTSLILL